MPTRPGKQAEKGVLDTDHEAWPCHLVKSAGALADLSAFLIWLKWTWAGRMCPGSQEWRQWEENDSLRFLHLSHGLTTIPAHMPGCEKEATVPLDMSLNDWGGGGSEGGLSSESKFAYQVITRVRIRSLPYLYGWKWHQNPFSVLKWHENRSLPSRDQFHVVLVYLGCQPDYI